MISHLLFENRAPMSPPANLQSEKVFPDPVFHDFAPISRQLLECESRRELLAGGEAVSIRGEIEELIRAARATVLSLDVFDTFLLRNDKAETARFLELSQLIQKNLVSSSAAPAEVPSDIDLLLARLSAMELSYRTRKAVDGCREGHIGDVVRIVRRSFGLGEEVDSLMLNAEIEYEVSNLYVNPVLLDVAAAFKANGGSVVLASDMYLGRKEIESILRLVDKRAHEVAEAVFSSADTILSKRSGKLYGYIESKLGAPASEFFHIGDALLGDVMKSREAGWHVLHFPIARAETARREESLKKLLQQTRDVGLDLTKWAKI